MKEGRTGESEGGKEKKDRQKEEKKKKGDMVGREESGEAD